MYRNKLNGAVRVAFWMLYALLFCYYGSCLSSLYSIPMSYDPIIYGIVGNGWMEGLMPYRDLFDQKGPLIFLIYGISFLLFKSFWLVFLLEWAAIFVSMVFSYKIAVLFISARKAFFISLLLVLLLCNFPYYGGGGHPSEFLLPFQLASLYFLIRLRQGGGSAAVTGIVFGLSMGIAILLKFNLAVFWFIPCIYVFILAWKKGKALHFSACLISATAITVAPLLLYFHLNGILGDFYRGYFLFNVSYGGGGDSLGSIIWNYVKWIKREVMDPNIFMWVAGVVGIGFSRLPKADKLAFASAFLLTCLGVQGNGRCAFCHYDHTLIPFGLAGCILVAGMVNPGMIIERRFRTSFFLISIACLAVYSVRQCINFGLPEKADLLYKSFRVERDMIEGTCVAVGSNAVWFYHANKLIPPVRTFIICASDAAMGEKEKMKQFAEIRQRDADCIVVTEGYFNKRKEESPSQQAMRAFLQEKYYAAALVKGDEQVRDVFGNVVSFCIYRRVPGELKGE